MPLSPNAVYALRGQRSGFGNVGMFEETQLLRTSHLKEENSLSAPLTPARAVQNVTVKQLCLFSNISCLRKCCEVRELEPGSKQEVNDDNECMLAAAGGSRG